MNMRYFFWGLFACVAIGFFLVVSSASGDGKETPAVSEESYSALMDNEVLDLQDLAEGAEIQRRMFNRITPSGFSWFQPMFPSVAPFDAKYFDESFLDGLLGEDTNSVAVYPLSLVLDPKTRETLVYNAEGTLIATVPADGRYRTWPEDADPARVTLKLELLPAEDAEQYLYTEDRIAETLTKYASKSAKTPGAGGVVMLNMMVGNTNFGILNFQRLTNGNMQLTVTNGTDVAEVYSYTVWHTSTVTTNPWEDEYGVTNIGTNTLWAPTSQTFNGLANIWDCRETNLVLSGGVGIWEDSDIPTNARVRFYGAAERADADHDGLTDGAELFVYHTSPTNRDTDGDGWSDAEELAEETDPLDRFSATRLAKGVVINEVLYNPDGNDDDKEWIELYSASRYPVELSGFSIQVASNDFYDAYVIPTNTWIQPGHCLLLGGTNVANRDLTVSLAIPNCFTNEPTGAVRLVAEVSTNTFVADTLMYGGNPSVFNENGLDTTGWLSTNVPWASASNSVVRWFAGLDSDRRQDWTWATTPTPTSSTNSLDSDGDGLTDQQELTGSENPFSEPTNQHNTDSDGDGLEDYAECETYGTDPNTWATDGDLFPFPPTNNYAVSNWWGSDSYELANGWDPLIYDENTNGIPDSWEMAFPGTNLYADADGDGISNYDELEQNSDPFSTNSVSPEPYVVVYQSSKPGWVNNGLVDVGLNGWVKIYFSGLKTNTCLGVWVKECSTQEEFKVEWIDATLNGSVWLNENREVVTSASAEANSHPYLLIQDLGLHPDFTATLGGEYTNAILTIELSNAWEADAVCNRIPNPKQTTRNRLFVATEDSDQAEIVVRASIQPTGFEDSFLCSIFDGSTHLTSETFSATCEVGMNFTPTGPANTYPIKVGIDGNGNGMLEPPEVCATMTNLSVTAFTSDQYADERDALESDAGWADFFGYNVGATLLYRLLNLPDRPCPFDTNTSININCFTQSNLTHNAGETFDSGGDGALDEHIWGASGEPSYEIANSVEARDAVNVILDAHSAEITGYFSSHPTNTACSTNWSHFNMATNFGETNYLPKLEYDLHVAFGHATFSEFNVFLVVEKDGLGNLSISSLTLSGNLVDLYDFNYEEGGRNSQGATLQVGWDSSMPSRDAGNIFFDRSYFQDSFSTWEYSF